MMRLLIYMILPLCMSAQQSAKQIIAAANNRFDKVVTYSAAINMTFNIPRVQMEPIAGKVFYKKPTKFRIHTKGIIFMPKQNPYFAMQAVRDTNSFTAILSGTEQVGSTKTVVVNVIPSDNTSDLILGKFWIEDGRQLVHKAQLTTKSSGTITIEQTFGSYATYGLPDGIKFVVDVAKFKIPKAVAMEINAKSKPKAANSTAKGTGEIALKFTAYKLNEKIDDKVFQNEMAQD